MKRITHFAAILMVSTMLQSQTTIRVTPDGSGNGASWVAASNLENAVKIAVSGDQIWVQKGTYFPVKMLTIPASVKIYGGFAGTETMLSQRNFSVNPTIIDGQQKIGSIFRLENSVEINGFIIQNGNANGNLQKNGGGIWADENCVIENCKIINNTAMLNGGGIYAKGKVKIISCIVENNAANGSGDDLFGNCVVLGSKQSGMCSGVDIADCNPNIPYFGEISFKTPTVWTISGNNIEQEWSDVVMAEGCNKNWFHGGDAGNYNSDCIANTNRSAYGDLFSWCAIARFAHVLCPAPWRVPTTEDFVNLDKALGGNGDGSGPGTSSTDAVGSKIYSNTSIYNKYMATSGTAGQFWGATYGGLYSATYFTQQGTYARYWTQTAVLSMILNKPGEIRPQAYGSHTQGLMLRCVK